MQVCDHRKLIRYCESFFEKHGDNYLGVGWTKKKEYADRRYRVMLEGIRPEWPKPLDVLDFGCGLSHLNQFIIDHAMHEINYSGLDLSDLFLAASRSKFPEVTYYQQDLVNTDSRIPQFDFIVMNGIFNSRGENSNAAMMGYLHTLLRNVGRFAKRGLAFNLMSKCVDWERGDLFHVSFDELAAFLDGNISRHFTIRHDYGLFEYTVYVYKAPLEEGSM